MIKDRRIALFFRLGSLLFAIVGVLKHIGVFNGIFGLRAFMYYTFQSNTMQFIHKKSF